MGRFPLVLSVAMILAAGCLGSSPPASRDQPASAPAGATQLPLRLHLTVSGCCYDPAQASGTPSVTLRLACSPPGGSAPDPAPACRRIAADAGRFFRPTPSESCIGFGPSEWALTISGVYRGARIERRYPNSACPSRENRAQMHAWTALLRPNDLVRLIVATGSAPG